MDNPLILLLRLEGPLQSWGERARWDYRDTAAMPTKSGIIGMLACALGKPRYDPLLPEMDEKLQMGVRLERSGPIATDYQTVSGTIRTADGGQRGKRNEGSTIQSWRQYLQDTAFLVALGGESELLQRCAAALKKPVWPIFLGRKSCVPTRPVFEGLTRDFTSIEDAIRNYPISEIGDTDRELLCEIEAVDDGRYYRRDKILETPIRTFGDRRIKILSVAPVLARR